jgi:hypothetical protein
MKKKNLKTLRLAKSTISSLHAQTVSGGTDSIIDITTIIIRDHLTVTGCSQLMACDSVAACPPTVGKTQFKDADTRPLC